MMFVPFFAVLLMTLVGVSNGQPAEDPAHAELRALRDDLVDSLNKRDLTRLLQHLHPDVVVTWQNAEVSRKPEGVRAYISRMTEGPDRLVDEFTATPTVDELTILHGPDTGVAFGSSRDHFKLTSGLSLDVNSRWTATVVRHDGRWKIAAFHASVNLFDNPLLAAARRNLWGVGAAALVAGILLGMLLSRSTKRAGGTR
jgi:ketosteroid isomerase-like protein